MKIVRQLISKDINNVLLLAYKAVYERGWVDKDFNKLDFNFKVKSVFVNANNQCYGLFDDDRLVGFAVANLGFLPWVMKRKCLIELIHTDTEHRNCEDYQMLFDAIMQFCDENEIQHVRTHSKSYLLDPDTKANFLMNNGFLQADIAWERKNDS